MLSLNLIASPAMAAYYAKDDFYIGCDGGSGETQLLWGGEGASRLGLMGHATVEDLKTILSGRNPDRNGEVLSRPERFERGSQSANSRRSGKPSLQLEPDARPIFRSGYELVFSAPKGVSIAILIGKDERLAIAHQEAVRAAMDYSETHFSFARLGTRKDPERCLTGNLVYAQATHSSSREGDPMVHTHVPVANMTFVEKVGGWRAMHSYSIFRHQRLLGTIYQASLADAAKTLGYDVRHHKDGLFELDAFNREQLLVFSKASERVNQHLAMERPETGAGKEFVSRMGRPHKLGLAKDVLLGRWEWEAERAGFAPEKIVEKARSAGLGREIDPQEVGKTRPMAGRFAALSAAVLDYINPIQDPYGYQPSDRRNDVDARATLSLSLQINEARRAVFSRHDVIKHALDAGVLSMTAVRLERELRALIADGRVKLAGAPFISGLTTDRSLATETEIVRRMQDGLWAAKPLYRMDAGLARVSPDAVLAAGHTHPMNRGQTAAAAMILTSPSAILAVQGAAGAGKTTLFSVVNKAAAEKGVELFGLTPSHSAKAALMRQSGMPTAVVSWFTTRYAHLGELYALATVADRKDWTKRALVVDEASLLSNEDTQKILRISDRLGIQKVIFVGDYRQHNSPGAGAPFRHLLNKEIPTARLDEILRQRDHELHDAVTALSKGDAKLGVKLLGDRIVQTPATKGAPPLIKTAFELWRASKDQGVTRPLIVQTQRQREMINDLVIQELVNRGEIIPTGHKQTRLVRVDMDGPARWDAKSYAAGQVLVFHAGYLTAGIAANDQVRIVGIKHKEAVNRLTVETPSGRTSHIDLNRLGRGGQDKFQTYNEKPGGEIYLGGALVWERSDPKRGLNTGERFTPMADTGPTYQIRLANGQTTTIAKDDPHLRFVGPGYAMTSHRSQSMTLEAPPIGIISSRTGDLATLYVQASRGVHDFTLVTENKARLLHRISHETGMNAIAHEGLARRTLDAKPERQKKVRGPNLTQSKDAGLESQRGAAPPFRSPPKDREDPDQNRPPMEKSIVRDLPKEMPDFSL